MGSKRLEGSFVAIVTPFNRDGSIDFEGFRTLIDFHADHGTSALLIMGSTGEVSMLSEDERHQVISETVKFKKNGLPLYYGCTCSNTRATIDMVRYAGNEGANGAIITVPAYIVPPVEDVISFYLEVADASKIPIGIYNNPARCGVDLSAEDIIRLADHPNIVVDKEAMPRVGQITQIAAAKKDISLMCCDYPGYGLVMPVMSLGGQGTANITGNIAPEELAVISKPWTSWEDAENCRKIFLELLPLSTFNYCKVNPVPVKSLMKALGLPAGDLRKPYRSLDGRELQQGIDIVKALGLVQKYGFSIR
jgi:4-hydroxy-tetrahydrodipicolinate synthase